MKKTLALVLLGLVWSSQGKALSYPTGATVTANSGEAASVVNSPIWGIDCTNTPCVERQVIIGPNGGITTNPGGGTQTTVADSSSNTAPVAAPPQENITAMSAFTLANNAVTVVNITTTVGTACQMGASWWLGSPSAAIYFAYGNLTFTPDTTFLAKCHQMAANALPLVAPYPAYAGAKIFMCGQSGAATLTVSTGEFRAK